MRQAFRVLVLCVIFCALFALGQDQPSLGDAARQARQEKQQKGAQAKDGQSKGGQRKDPQGKDAQPAKAQKVITNDEIPEHAPVTVSHASADQPRGISYPASPSGGSRMSAEQWKSRILVQKNMIATMQSAINKLNNSIHFANCAGNCVQWNRRQVKKQREVERLEAQLEDQKKGLEDMQESARRQGYGSSVYDP